MDLAQEKRGRSVETLDILNELIWMIINIYLFFADDDVQCIIVVPEGQTLEDAVRNANISPADQSNSTPSKKWTKLLKKRLLIEVLRHVKAHKSQRINSNEMWTEISKKMPDKSPVICRRMYLRIKKNKLAKTADVKMPSYNTILDKILALEPKFFKKRKIVLDEEMKVEALEPMDIYMDIYKYDI